MACVWALHEIQCIFLYWDIKQFRPQNLQDVASSQINYNRESYPQVSYVKKRIIIAD